MFEKLRYHLNVIWNVFVYTIMVDGYFWWISMFDDYPHYRFNSVINNKQAETKSQGYAEFNIWLLINDKNI